MRTTTPRTLHARSAYWIIIAGFFCLAHSALQWREMAARSTSDELRVLALAPRQALSPERQAVIGANHLLR